MEVASKYTRMFVSDSLTNEKYNELLTYAVYLRDLRNEVSAHVNAHLLDYVDTPALQFVTLMRERYSISSNFDTHLYRLVIDCYRNKYEVVKKKLEFHVTELLGFERYKRDCKNGRKGELKNVRYKKVKTPLSTCLTYLARYGNENTVEYIESQLADPSLDEKRREFYEGILNRIEKFTFRRLMSLTMQRRERFLRRYFAKPIEFKSLTFSGRSSLHCGPTSRVFCTCFRFIFRSSSLSITRCFFSSVRRILWSLARVRVSSYSILTPSRRTCLRHGGCRSGRFVLFWLL